MGHNVSGTTWLLPEEMLLLLEQGAAVCYIGDGRQPLSLQHAYAMMLGNEGGAVKQFSVEDFLVYGYLKRLGYIVRRTDFKVETPSGSRKPMQKGGRELVPVASSSWSLGSLLGVWRQRFGRVFGGMAWFWSFGGPPPVLQPAVSSFSDSLPFCHSANTLDRPLPTFQQTPRLPTTPARRPTPTFTRFFCSPNPISTDETGRLPAPVKL